MPEFRNEPKITYDPKHVKLIERTISQWLSEFCQEKDTLVFHKMPDGTMGLSNTRSGMMYVITGPITPWDTQTR